MEKGCGTQVDKSLLQVLLIELLLISEVVVILLDLVGRIVLALELLL